MWLLWALLLLAPPLTLAYLYRNPTSSLTEHSLRSEAADMLRKQRIYLSLRYQKISCFQMQLGQEVSVS